MSVGPVLSRRPMCGLALLAGSHWKCGPYNASSGGALEVAAASRRVYNAQLEGSYVHCVADD